MNNIYIPHTVILPEDIHIERIPETSNIDNKDIDSQFDKHTLFYDIFYSRLKHKIYCIGPPLLNLRRHINIKSIFINNSSVNYKVYDLNCMFMLEINIHETFNQYEYHTINLVFNTFEHNTILQNSIIENTSYICIATLQKDNPIKWINEWCEWHHVVHDVNTIVLYDNGSSYLSDIYNKIGIYETCNIFVVKWNYAYGIKKLHQTYAQIGALNHLRLKWGHCFNWIISLDIDEYLYLNDCNTLRKYLLFKERKHITAVQICPINMPSIKTMYKTTCRSAYQYIYRSKTEALSRKENNTHKYIYQPKYIEFIGVHNVGMYQRNMSPYPGTLRYDNIARLVIKIFYRYLIYIIPYKRIILRYLNVHYEGYVLPEVPTRMCYYHYRGLNTEWREPSKYEYYNKSIHEIDLNVMNMAIKHGIKHNTSDNKDINNSGA